MPTHNLVSHVDLCFWCAGWEVGPAVLKASSIADPVLLFRDRDRLDRSSRSWRDTMRSARRSSRSSFTLLACSREPDGLSEPGSG